MLNSLHAWYRMVSEVENKEDERIRAAFDAASQRDEGDPTNDHHALPDNYLKWMSTIV